MRPLPAGIVFITQICATMMSDMSLHHHNMFKSFRNVYGVSVISTMLLKMYVQYFPVAVHLICVVLVLYRVAD